MPSHLPRLARMSVAALACAAFLTTSACEGTDPPQEDISLPASAMLADTWVDRPDPAPVEGPVPDRLFDPGGQPLTDREPTPDGSDTRTPRPLDRSRDRVAGFIEADQGFHPIPEGFRPYQSGTVRPVPFGRVDTEGVRVFRADWDGRTYDHPISQAQYALAALESYRLSGEQEYLDVAVRNAERIVDRRDTIDGAWYFPYDFDFDLYRNERGVLTAPWVSGMATGQALSLFSRLYEVSGDSRWREAADATFAAFLQAPDGEGYFVSFVDTAGELWLEEYSRYPVSSSERVLNGHMWSMFGLWDYWSMNGQDHPDAEQLFRGALHTLEKTAVSEFRNPGWASYYSIWQGQLAHTYHQYHQEQFLMIYRMTHDPLWITRASMFRNDWPHYRDTTGDAVITAGVDQVYRLDDEAVHIKDRSMEILETRDVEISEERTHTYDRRGRIPDGPVVIRLGEGELEGWWVEEGPEHAYPAQGVDFHFYEPAAALSVDEQLETTVYHYDRAGRRVDERQVVLEPGESYPTDRSAYLQGRPLYQLSDGPLRGWWLPEGVAHLPAQG